MCAVALPLVPALTPDHGFTLLQHWSWRGSTKPGAIPLQTYMDSLSACGVEYEHLDARDIMRRWPLGQI